MKKTLLIIAALFVASCSSTREISFEQQTCSFSKDCGIISVHHHSAEFWQNY